MRPAALSSLASWSNLDAFSSCPHSTVVGGGYYAAAYLTQLPQQHFIVPGTSFLESLLVFWSIYLQCRAHSTAIQLPQHWGACDMQGQEQGGGLASATRAALSEQFCNVCITMPRCSGQFLKQKTGHLP